MAISKIMKNTSLLWGGVLFFFFACNNKHAEHVLTVTQSDSITNFRLMDDNSRIFVFGAHYISFAKNIKFMGCLTTQDTLLIFNISKGQELQKIRLPNKAFGLSAKDSCLYVFYENGTHYQKIVFSDSITAKYTMDTIQTLPMFNDTVFLSAFANTRINLIDNETMLLPYRIINNTHNYIDTFSYMLVNVTKPFSVLKLARYPELSKHDYLFKTISDYDFKHNKLAYAFQKNNIIHIADINSKKEVTFEIEKLHVIDFPKKELRNISFTRRYLKQNDKISKVLFDHNSNVYVIVKLRTQDEYKYRIYFYNSASKQLNSINTKMELFTDMAFIQNNKLVIPNENNRYSMFSTAN